ncbi:hypothetical protein FX983_00001 [Pseudomonas frederiksbergensis]|uniref:Uncharacterized protein n=1 Tax=Pseudomonas frederiksbergensis TaxID=104087 RepID=A0A6L5BUN0_9PSED|nr:hypothetical protein FX983_00001 [Pseudomonas frederiksbergensis]
MTSQRIVWRDGVNGARSFADVDGDRLTVGQSHDNRGASNWLADRRGVNHGAAFSNAVGGGQFDGRSVDGIGDVSHCRNCARYQILEVAAGSGGDRRFDFAGVFVNVIGWRRNSRGASGFTGFNGDHGAVRQSNGDRRASSVGQGRGVGDRTALSNGVSRAQAQVRGVSRVSNRGRNRRLISHQILVVTTAHVSDRVGQWRMTSQCIVRRNGVNGAGGFTDVDGDRLTVGQSHGNWRAGYRLANCRGVNHGAAFSNAVGGSQFDGRSVDGVGDIGHCRNSARHQILEVAAGSGGDRRFDFARVFVNVIGWRRNSRGASGFTGFNGDHGAVRQSNGDRRASGVGQCRGVNNRSTFGHRVSRAQAEGSGVWRIGNRGLRRFTINFELLVVAALRIINLDAQGAAARQGIVRCNEVHAATACPDRNGDGLAVRQGDDDWRAGHRSGNGRGVDHGAAFGNGRRGSQVDRRSVDGVGDVGHGRRRIGCQGFKVAAAGVLDRGFNLAGVFVDVISRGSDGYGAAGGAGGDGDHRAIAQAHGYRSAGRIGQGCGVDDRAALGHGIGRAQAQGRGVRRIADRRVRRLAVHFQFFVVAAGGAVDLHAQGRAARQWAVRRDEIHAAAGFAHRDGDGLAVGQAHHNRRAGHRSGNGRGVDHGFAFGDVRGGGQRYGAGVDGVIDGGNRRGVAADQVLEVATGRAFDGRFNGAGIFINVVLRRIDGHSAGGFTCVDGDHGAVAQRHGHWGAGCIGQGRGVSDLAAFIHGAGRAQRQVGGVGGIGHGGADRCFVSDQVFVVAAADVGDRVGQWCVAIEHVVRRDGVDGASGFADVDSDRLTVGQVHNNRGASDWLADGGGVNHSAAFSDAVGRGQGDGRGVDGVGDVGHRWSGARYQVLEVTAGSGGNRCFDFAGVFINVIGWRWNSDGAGGFARVDGDYGAIAQGHGHRSAGRIGQCRGVSNLAAFSYRVSRAQAQVRGV